MIRLSNPFRVAAVSTVALTLSMAAPTLAHADDYTLAFTYGQGAYPRSAPAVDARTGDAVAEGTLLTGFYCASVGEEVTNDYGYTSSVWMRDGDGHYWSEAYLFTNAEGIPDGIGDCDTDEPAIKESEGLTLDDIETPEAVSGLRVAADNGVPVWQQLLSHYYGNSGEAVAIDWSFFENNDGFTNWALTLPVDNTEVSYASSVMSNGADMFGALGTFAVRRTSENCFVIRDDYDYDMNSLYGLLAADAEAGYATEFEVNSSGCI